MNRVGAAGFGGGDDRLDPQIGLRRQRLADPHRLVGLANMPRVAVGIRIDRDHAIAEAARGAHDAQRDLAAVGDQDLGERRRLHHAHGRATENCMRWGVRASASRQIASTSRQNASCIARVDHAVVEHARRGREHVHLAVEHADYLRLHGLQLFLLDRLAAPDGSSLGHDRHGFGGLLAAHDRGLGVGPGETEARMEAAAAHAVIAGAERCAAIDRDLRHGRRRHRLDHFGAVLDHAGLFIGLADHVAGGVVEIEQRRARLAAGLDEMRRLVGAVGSRADRYW